MSKIQICTGCHVSGVDRAEHEAAVGRLAERIKEDFGIAIAVERYPCLGGCHNRGRLCCSSPGKWGWLFGGVDPGVDGDSLHDFIAVWHASLDGMVVKNRRPKPLRPKILGRLPPV